MHICFAPGAKKTGLFRFPFPTRRVRRMAVDRCRPTQKLGHSPSSRWKRRSVFLSVRIEYSTQFIRVYSRAKAFPTRRSVYETFFHSTSICGPFLFPTSPTKAAQVSPHNAIPGITSLWRFGIFNTASTATAENAPGPTNSTCVTAGKNSVWRTRRAGGAASKRRDFTMSSAVPFGSDRTWVGARLTVPPRTSRTSRDDEETNEIRGKGFCSVMEVSRR